MMTIYCSYWGVNAGKPYGNSTNLITWIISALVWYFSTMIRLDLISVSDDWNEMMSYGRKKWLVDREIR